MAKYIDAGKLKYEIERRNLSEHYTTERYEEELYEIIDSLEDEQPVDGLEEAAGAYLDNHKPLTRYNWGDLMDAFKAGAEWAMKQGVKTTGTISPRGIIYDTNVGYHLFLERYHNGDKVEIQIRKIKENGK